MIELAKLVKLNRGNGNVRNEVDTHLALGCFDCRVRLTGRYRIALREKLQEMVSGHTVFRE